MVLSSPWRQHISIGKPLVSCWVVKGVGNAMKCAYFVSQSHMTQMTEWSAETGKLVIKSIDISSHTCFGIDNFWSNP